ICDYMNIPRDMSRKVFRIIAFLLITNGLVIPIFGGKPVLIMIASQAVSPVVMPLIILFLLILLNNKKIVGEYKNGPVMNIILVLTLLFSMFMCYSALIGLKQFFNTF
ncbi:divalent metal cation transporter, partial [bacterium]|nr:divalent metal cation transporter [bacterium]